MKVAHTLEQLRDCRSELPSRVGLVPTMGALHRGHQSLMERTVKECESVVVSIFVNPTQFAPGEDFEAYPRPLEQDLDRCRQSGVDLVWVPQVAELYPEGAQTSVRVEPLGSLWEGVSRPTHFQGVATVVTKLLAAVQPDLAYFGEKDLQQLQVIRRLVRDLLLQVEVRGVPIARDDNGLALSSRNSYLNEEQRVQAAHIYRALKAAQQSHNEGQTGAQIKHAFRDWLAQNLEEGEVERLDLINANFEKEVGDEESASHAHLCVAVRYHGVRLIDQMELCS